MNPLDYANDGILFCPTYGSRPEDVYNLTEHVALGNSK